MGKRNLEKRQEADLAAILKLPQGRRLLWRLLQATQVDGHGFVPADPYATAFHCGQRSIGVFLKEQIMQISPFVLAQMRAEYVSELTSQQNEINRESEEMHNV